MAEVDVEKCKLTRYPAEVITNAAKPVEKIDDSIRLLVEKMTDIMFKNKGIGLAAPQAGIGVRLFITSLDRDRNNVKVYINPTVIPNGGLESMEEGCLSVTGIYTKIRRYEKCTVTATDLDGNEFIKEAEGLYARCLQHEYDHIEGMTIVSRMGQTAKIVHRKQLRKLEEEQKSKGA